MINLVTKAIAAFRRKDYIEVLLLLDEAFEYIQALDYTAIDAAIFNALYDAYEMLALIAELAVFEKNDYLKASLNCYQKALDDFTKPEGGTLSELQKSFPDFLQLLRGMSVAARYLRHRSLRINDFPPVLSFEITADGHIRLFAWDEENPNRIADIETLREEFSRLFIKNQTSKAFFLEQSQLLFEQEAFDEAIQILDEAVRQHPDLKGEFYLQKGYCLFQLGQYADAVDMLMKARLLGEPKHRFLEKGRQACAILIEQVEDKEEINKWKELLRDFFDGGGD